MREWTNKPWTVEDDKKLEEGLEKGMTQEQIGKTMGRSKISINHRIITLGLKGSYRRYWSEEKVADLIKKFNSGMGVKTIAREYGCTFPRVNNKLKELGLIQERKAKRNELNHKVEKLYYEGAFDKEIAEELNISINDARAVRQRRKLRVTIKPLNDEEKKLLLELIEQEATCAEIEQKLKREKKLLIRELRIMFGENEPKKLRIFYIKNSYTRRGTQIFQKLDCAKKTCIQTEREFSITEDDIWELFYKQDFKCYYTGVELSGIPGKWNHFSIDRIDSNKGYIKGNLVLCCALVNAMKMDSDINHFIELCHLVAKTHPIN